MLWLSAFGIMYSLNITNATTFCIGTSVDDFALDKCWLEITEIFFCKDFDNRSSHPEVFLGKGVLKICSKFIGEYPCRSEICAFSEHLFLGTPLDGCFVISCHQLHQNIMHLSRWILHKIWYILRYVVSNLSYQWSMILFSN